MNMWCAPWNLGHPPQLLASTFIVSPAASHQKSYTLALMINYLYSKTWFYADIIGIHQYYPMTSSTWKIRQNTRFLHYYYLML